MKLIVLIEDNAGLREAFRLILDPDTFRVEAFSNGKDVFDEQVDAPNLFVIDKNLSGSSGLDVCRFIKKSEKYKKTPVIIFSAEPVSDETWQAVGAECFIKKPFSVKQMREYVMKHASN